MDAVETLVWGGSVPLAFVLAASDVATLHPPSARYVLAPRVAYLPQLVESALAVFQQAVAPAGGGNSGKGSGKGGEQHVWFEAGGVPLKWQLPVGVLVDAVRAHAPGEISLPLTIVVHFHNFPSDALMRYEGQHAARRAYVNVLKQSACLHFGSAKPVLTGLSQVQQEQMWGAIATGNHAQFWSCNDALHGARCPTPARRRCIRIVSVKSSLPGGGGHGGFFSGSSMGNSGGGAGFRIRAVLCPFDEESAGGKDKAESTTSDQGGAEKSDGVAAATTTIGEFLQSYESGDGGRNNQENQTVIVHGVEVPLTASVADIHERMASADNCLYLIVN